MRTNAQVLRPVHLSASDDKGGAAKAALRLHSALVGAGVASSMLVRRRLTDTEGVAELAGPAARLHRRMAVHVERTGRRADGIDRDEPRSYGVTPTRWSRTEAVVDADLVHVHWTGQGALSPGDLGAMTRPLVITLHDQWWLRGLFHLEPRTAVTLRGRAADRAARWWKQRHLSRHRGLFIAPSQWMAAWAAPLAGAVGWRVEVAPNSLDVERFSPARRPAGRQALGVGSDELVVLFAANDLGSSIKGIRHGLDALAGVSARVGRRCHLVMAGAGGPGSGGDVRDLGSLASDDLADVVAGADLVVVPSRFDNFPQVATEAQAAGVPVVTTDAGGCPETVEDGVTGTVVPVADAAALRAAVDHFLLDPAQREAFARAGVARARRLWAPPVVAARHLALYDELLLARSHADGRGR